MRLTGLWRNADFVRFWASRTVSLLGSQITFLALPLTAVLILDATPTQMGFLSAARTTPPLLVGLFAGVWVDRHRRRPLLIAADLGHAALLILIPIAAALGALRMQLLYIVMFLIGALAPLSNVARPSYLPSLVGREHLIEANSKLAMSRSAAETVGPGTAGALVQLITAPMAIALDAMTFLVSALLLHRIRTPEQPPNPSGQRQDARREIGEGLRFVFSIGLLRTSPYLWSVSTCSTASWKPSSSSM